MRSLTQSLLLVLFLALPANAARADPEADVRRALIERQQRTDELVLRLRQSQHSPAPGNIRLQRELDALHIKQLQKLQMLNMQQLRQFDASQLTAPADPTAARTLMLQQQQIFERDRRLELQQFRWEEEQEHVREQLRGVRTPQ